MKIECPVCKAQLEHKRRDDGVILNLINKDGSGVKEVGNRSDGYDQIYCSADESHELPEELQEKALEIADQHSY